MTTMLPSGQERSARRDGVIVISLALEIEDHALLLQAVDAEHALGAEIAAGERRRLDAVDRAPADPEAGEHHGRDPADLGHRMDDDGAAGTELELAGQLVGDDGALGAGVDDETIGALAADADRHGHPGRRVGIVAERLGLLLVGKPSARFAPAAPAPAAAPRGRRPRRPRPTSEPCPPSSAPLPCVLSGENKANRREKAKARFDEAASRLRPPPSPARAAARRRRRGCPASRRARRRPRPRRC